MQVVHSQSEFYLARQSHKAQPVISMGSTLPSPEMTAELSWGALLSIHATRV